ASMRRATSERQCLLEALGTLYTAGYDVDWSKLYPERGRYVDLPTYVWDRQPYWSVGSTKRAHLGPLLHGRVAQTGGDVAGSGGRRFAVDIDPAKPAAVSIAETLRRMPEEQRNQRLETYVRTTVSQVLGHRVDELPNDTPLDALGLDSLLFLGLKRRFGEELGIPTTGMSQERSLSWLMSW